MGPIHGGEIVHIARQSGAMEPRGTSFLEPHQIAPINDVALGQLNVPYDPGLVQTQRYPSDHNGQEPALSAAERENWKEWLGTADLVFDIDWMGPGGLLLNTPLLAIRRDCHG